MRPLCARPRYVFDVVIRRSFRPSRPAPRPVPSKTTPTAAPVTAYRAGREMYPSQASAYAEQAPSSNATEALHEPCDLGHGEGVNRAGPFPATAAPFSGLRVF